MRKSFKALPVICALILGISLISIPSWAMEKSVTTSKCMQGGGRVIPQHILETCAGGTFNGVPVVDIVRKGSGGEGKQPSIAGRPPGSPEPEEEPVQQ